MRAARPAVLAGVVALATMAVPVGWSPPASAAQPTTTGVTRYVAPQGHDGTNACTSKTAPCRTIRHALGVAGRGDTVQLAAGTYAEHGLTVRISVKIVGSRAATTLLTGSGEGAVFVISSGAVVSIEHLTIGDGVTSGHGGAITNSGTLTLTHDCFENNSATDPGGAITNYATIDLLARDQFLHNNSESNGGAIENFGTIGRAAHDLFAGNIGNDGAGAFDNDGSVGALDDSTFVNNVSDVEAGAVVNEGTIGDLSGDTFDSNRSEGGIGGALENIFGTIGSLTNDTFASNTAVGGLSQGGAIEQDFATIVLMADDTIIDNSAAIGGGLDNENGVIESIEGVIMAGNTAQQGPNCYFFDGAGGSVTDGGYNLLGDTADTCGFSTARHDLINVQPDLLPLGRYGGTTKTAPPQAGSPVIDAGGPAPCPTAVDQIGTSRPVGPACDIGSVEYDGAQPAR